MVVLYRVCGFRLGPNFGVRPVVGKNFYLPITTEKLEIDWQDKASTCHHLSTMVKDTPDFGSTDTMKATRFLWVYESTRWSTFFQYFPAFALDMERSVLTPNAGKYGKNVDQNNSEYGHFLRSEYSRFRARFLR